MKDERVYLGHIREAIADIRTYAAAGEVAFQTDRMRQDAIIRKLEVIGEAVKHLSDDTRDRQPDIPSKADRWHARPSTHAYIGVELTLVWRVIECDSVPLDAAVAALLERCLRWRTGRVRCRHSNDRAIAAGHVSQGPAFRRVPAPVMTVLS